MKLLTKIKKLLFFTSILIFALSGLSFVVSPRPIIPVAQAACLIPPPVCVLNFCVDSPLCALDTGDLKDAGKVALSLAGKGFGEIDDVLAKVASHGGDACSVVVKLASELSPVDFDKLVKKYGCDNIPGGGGGSSSGGGQDGFTGCETPIMTERGRDFCESFSSHQCFWYSGYSSESPSCRTNSENMDPNQLCRDGGHCYIGQTCQPGNYCSSTPESPSTSPAPTSGGGSSGGTDTCTEVDRTKGFEWKCMDGCSGGFDDTKKTNTTPFHQCTAGLTCCVKKTVAIGSGTGTGTGSTTPAPTPATPTEIGYCGDSVPTLGTLKPVNGATCATTSTGNLRWIKRSTDSSGYDKYCDRLTGQQQVYFYECASGTSGGGSTTPTPTTTASPTPTTFVPISQGGVCNPVQGPWQCQSPNVCLTVPGEGRCCPAGTQWINNQCVTPTSTPAPTTTQTPTNPTPISTGSTCNDYIPASNIHQVCRTGVNSCIGTEVQNTDGNKACSDFYQNTSTCCQLPPSAGPAGGSCNLPGRTCNPSSNTSTGTNIACTGCGGYCVGSGTTGSCQNPY